MPPRSTLYREGRETVILAIPLIAGQISQMLIMLADTLMLGRVGVVPLAAAAFAGNVLHLPFMLIIGMSVAVSIRVSQARGAEDPAAARAALRHGMYIGAAVGAFTTLLAISMTPLLHLFQQDDAVTGAAGAYFMIIAVSMIPVSCTMVVKNHADAMNHPWPAFWIMFGGVILNIVLNWVFIYGNLGAPRMELEGAGLATLLARSLTLAGLIYWCTHFAAVREWVPYHWFRKPDWPAIRSLIKVGLPTSLQLLAESSAFVAATVLIGTISKEALASHQVAITCAATVFMVPLGLSMALTVRTGESWGAGTLHRLRPILISSWLIAAGYTLFSASGFILFNEEIASWFVKDSGALQVAAALLIVAAAFQFSDSMQIISSGALRGLNDVRVPAWLAFLAYWIISLPIGAWCSFKLEWGAAGMWWGITGGLTFTAIALSVRAWMKTKV